MEIKQISKQLVVTGTLLIWAIKFVIRPFYLPDYPVKFFLGIAPNLLGSFLIPFAAYSLFSGRGYLLARVFRIESVYQLRQICMMGFGMLVLNEYLQLIPVFGRTFDLYDILFSFIGLSASYFAFMRLQQRYKIPLG